MIIFTPPVEDAAARCPVEPGTLRVFNWGGMRSLLHRGAAIIFFSPYQLRAMSCPALRPSLWACPKQDAPQVITLLKSHSAGRSLTYLLSAVSHQL